MYRKPMDVCCEEMDAALRYKAIMYHGFLQRYMMVGEDSQGAGRILQIGYCPFCAKAIGRYKYFRT